MGRRPISLGASPRTASACKRKCNGFAAKSRSWSQSLGSEPLHKADQGTLVRALVVAAWLIIVRCPHSFAQDTIGHLASARQDFAYQPLVACGGEFTDDTEWGSPEAKFADMT